jgi:hypothetical protein
MSVKKKDTLINYATQQSNKSNKTTQRNTTKQYNYIFIFLIITIS